MLNLAAKWEKHRVPLIAKVRELKAGEGDQQVHAGEPRVLVGGCLTAWCVHTCAQGEIQAMMDEIREMREAMKVVMVDGRKEESLYQQLVAEYKSLPKVLLRVALSAYDVTCVTRARRISRVHTTHNASSTL